MTESETGAAAPPLEVPGASPSRMSQRLAGWLARHAYGVLALLCVALWTPGILNLPPLDRDESRFAQSSRQMLESGNFVDIRFGQVPRYKKPVGIYWLQAATTAVAGTLTGAGDSHIWTYRLGSLLGAVAAVWFTVWCAAGVAEPFAAFLAGALMAGTLLLAAEATIATTDAVLLAAILAMQGVVLRVYRAARDDFAPRPSGRLVMAGWAAMAVGILVKGPVAPAVAAATLFALCVWDRKARWLLRFRPLPGLAVLLAIVLPWLIAIALQSHGAFFQQSLGGDFAAKLAGGQESHGAPPGYFLLLSAITFWPAILFVAPGILHGVALRAAPGVRALLAWAGACWLLFEAVPTKLPHYVLPCYPALAILAALWLCDQRLTMRFGRIALWAAAVQFTLGAGVLAAALVLAPRLYGAGDVPWLLAAAGVGGALALAALALFALAKRGAALALALAAAFVFIPALTAGAGPRLSQLWVSERLAALTAQYRAPGDPPPVLAGYEEPSMLFALGADIVLSDGRGAADVAADRGGIALVEDGARGDFLARLAERQADASALATLSGFNYSRGRQVRVTLYRVTRVPAP